MTRFLILAAIIGLVFVAFWKLAGDPGQLPGGTGVSPFGEAVAPGTNTARRGRGGRGPLARPDASTGAAGAQGAVPQPPAPKEGKDPFGSPWGAIQGVVTADDGPVAGASVRLFENLSAQGGSVLIEGDLIAEEVSNGDGAFRMDGLSGDRPGILRVEHPDFPRWTAPVTLAPGRTLQVTAHLGGGVDLVLMVKDAGDGHPLPTAWARIEALEEPLPDGGFQVDREVHADDAGRCLLRAVSAGMRRIVVGAPGYAVQTLPPRPVRRGRPSPPLEVRLQPGASISGRVLAPSGGAIAGARVRARPVASPGKMLLGDHMVLTDGAGRFVLSGLAAGNWVLSADKVGFTGGRFLLDDTVTPPLYGTSSVNATAGDGGVALYLVPAPILEGRVLDDETGEPIKAFRLFTHPSRRPAAIDPGRIRSVVSEDGTFRYPLDHGAIVARHFWLHVLAPGHAPEQVELGVALGLNGRVRARAPIYRDIEVRLIRGSEVSGRVVDPSGAPVEGAHVAATHVPEAGRGVVVVAPDAVSQGPWSLGRVEVSTDASGRFRLEHLDEGGWKLAVDHPGFAHRVVDEAIQVGRREVRDVGDVRLEKGGAIKGLVRDARGDPREGVEVVVASLDRPGFRRSRRTNIGGAYVFENLPPGRYAVTLTAAYGRVTARREVTLQPGGSIRQDFP